MKISWNAVSARRLERHALTVPVSPDKIAEQAGIICGVHAQIITAAELSLALRLDGAKRTTVREALWTDHSLIKTYGPRGTVHLLPASEMAMWTGALSALPQTSGHAPEVRMSAEQTDTVVDAIADALLDAELTVDELTDAIVARAGTWAGELVMPAFQGMWARWRQVTSIAAYRGVLCFGPNRGRNVTYTNPRRWLPDLQPAEAETALANLIKHYLYAYGPATPAQIAQWLAAPPGWIKMLFGTLEDDLELVEFESIPAWVVAGDTEVPTTLPEGVNLLPCFDAYVVGCHPRDRLYPGRAWDRALARTQAGNFPVMLIDGVVAGVWHQKRAGKYIDITVEPLDDLSTKHHYALEEQVVRVGEILEGMPRLTIGKVTVGAHA